MTFFKVCQKVNKSHNVYVLLSHPYKSKPRTLKRDSTYIYYKEKYFSDNKKKRFPYLYTCNVKCSCD